MFFNKEKRDKKIRDAKAAEINKLKRMALEKVDLIKLKIESESAFSYGSREQGLEFIVDDLNEVLLNWE
jgi:hypothetical protein